MRAAAERRRALDGDVSATRDGSAVEARSAAIVFDVPFGPFARVCGRPNKNTSLKPKPRSVAHSPGRGEIPHGRVGRSNEAPHLLTALVGCAIFVGSTKDW